VVKSAIEKSTGERFAIKMIDKKLVGHNNMVQNEVAILKRVNHANIISMKDIYESETHLFVVMEL
jgi:calcium/calmodulin-dependent protein kinase I